MRTTYKLAPLGEWQAGFDLMEELARVHPVGVRQPAVVGHRSFTFEGEEGDTVTQGVLRALLDAGFVPRLNLGERVPAKVFDIQICREYAPSDLRDFVYLELFEARGEFGVDGGIERTEPGVYPRLVAKAGQRTIRALEKGARFGCYQDIPLITERLRPAFEAEGFAHLLLRPILWSGDPALVARVEENPVWELATDLLSPPYVPGPSRFDARARLLAEHEHLVPEQTLSTMGPAFPEVLYPWEHRLRRSEVEALGPFDVAASRMQSVSRWRSLTGHTGPVPLEPDPPLPLTYPRIVSRRFFDFCVAQCLPITWRPVHLVD